MALIACPKCRSNDTRRATAYWQCLSCANEWQPATWEPPFKVDHQHGAALRYTARDGRKRLTTGRRSFVYGRVYVDALLTGQAADGVYEMQVTRNGPWHQLHLAPEDAAAALAANRLARGRLRRLQARPDYVLKAVAS